MRGPVIRQPKYKFNKIATATNGAKASNGRVNFKPYVTTAIVAIWPITATQRKVKRLFIRTDVVPDSKL